MRTVLAHGVFDLLHSGHIAHLQQARSFGDYLIVSIVSDKFADKGRALINDQRERMFSVGALKCVDEVVLCDAVGPQELLRRLRPYIYVRSDEYIDQSKPEFDLLKELGIAVGFTRSIPPHTTDLIARIVAQHKGN